MLSWSLLLLSFHHIEGQSDSSDHYSRSEVDSMKTIVFTNHIDIDSDSDSDNDSDSDSTKLDRDHPTTWYILGLSGNTSLVHRQLPDFMNYLRINLGSLTGSDYENVMVNSVSYVPSLLVNVSFSGNYSVSQLLKLADRNDSVLVLSSVSFYLTSFTSSQDILIPKPLTNSLSTPREEEALLYLGVGAAIAFVLSAGVLVSILILVSKKDRVKDKEPLIGQSTSFSRYQDPPQMIYSENFSQGIEREKECLNFTPLDDNFLPIETEVDFVPRYIKEDDRSSWLSDGSVIDNLPLDYPIQCAKKQNLSTFSDEGSEQAQDLDRRSQMSKSPFYWNAESHSPLPGNTPSPVPTLTPSPLPPHLASQHSNGVVQTRKRPPRPPSRTDSLNPNSTAKRRPKSSLVKPRRSSDLPGRPLSVPAPYHLVPRPGSMLSIPCPTARRPSSSCSTKLYVSQEEIDKDVDLILRNLDIEQ
eukprot:GFUD01012641.1.p1 GENE.GFUD01012641.1~~GFUD01012641.1.p1  ORF type:complete len:470 (-),score=74.08 GFUD01012641.1:33-1442(-)